MNSTVIIKFYYNYYYYLHSNFNFINQFNFIIIITTIIINFIEIITMFALIIIIICYYYYLLNFYLNLSLFPWQPWWQMKPLYLDYYLNLFFNFLNLDFFNYLCR